MIKIKTASSKKEMSTQRIPLHRSCQWWVMSGWHTALVFYLQLTLPTGRQAFTTHYSTTYYC